MKTSLSFHSRLLGHCFDDDWKQYCFY
jgi:hypothetical protein